VSESFPRRLYWSRHIVPKTNDLVYFKPPRSSVFALARERDYIEPSPLGTYQPLIKKIVAEKGDIVSVTDEGVIVNGKEIPNSKPKVSTPVLNNRPQVVDSFCAANQIKILRP
jgi:conjugative transfer signal peptidase TraF